MDYSSIEKIASAYSTALEKSAGSQGFKRLLRVRQALEKAKKHSDPFTESRYANLVLHADFEGARALSSKTNALYAQHSKLMRRAQSRHGTANVMRALNQDKSSAAQRVLREASKRTQEMSRDALPKAVSAGRAQGRLTLSLGPRVSSRG